MNNQLTTDVSYGKIDVMRKRQIFSQIARHLNALVHLIAELVIGEKIEL